TEDACDRLQSWATSAKSDTARKRELETMLRDGHICILCCTDAVGMGCDIRNIERVLWKLPPSFCALAQRSGRAARDFERLEEAILFAAAKVLKYRVAEEGAQLARVEAAEPQNQEGETDQLPAADPADTNQDEGVDVVGGQAVPIAQGGARVEQGDEAENAEAETAAAAAAKSKKRKAARISFADALEAKFVSRFACTTTCRRIIWDEYFQNATK
ncbi:hypothetical protein B0H13DRAFT_1481879, partial [Mycena leptocephala]